MRRRSFGATGTEGVPLEERAPPGHVKVVLKSLLSRGVAMPGARNGPRARTAAAPRPDGHAAGARVPAASEARDDAPRGAIAEPVAALRDLLSGLCAGDLETVLLTVAMAAEENRMPSADPDEAARILSFLARLAAHDAALPPPCPDRLLGGG